MARGYVPLPRAHGEHQKQDPVPSHPVLQEAIITSATKVLHRPSSLLRPFKVQKLQVHRQAPLTLLLCTLECADYELGIECKEPVPTKADGMAASIHYWMQWLGIGKIIIWVDNEPPCT